MIMGVDAKIAQYLAGKIAGPARRAGKTSPGCRRGCVPRRMKRRMPRGMQGGLQRGMTLLELIIACAILLVLASAAWPIARYSALRYKEVELRSDLEAMRDALDAYRECADKQQIKTTPGGSNYPPDLETLVKGVPLTANGSGTLGASSVPGASSGSSDGKIIRFLRKIPVDPMTGHADWGLRGVEDDLDSITWGGKDVFDVYSTSTKTAMNGTRYTDW
jgi:general secretion pathway protein G